MAHRCHEEFDIGQWVVEVNSKTPPLCLVSVSAVAAVTVNTASEHGL